MPILHLLGAVLVAPGLVLVYFGVQASFSALTSMNSDSGGGTLSIFGGILSLTGVILGGVARFLDSRLLSQR